MSNPAYIKIRHFSNTICVAPFQTIRFMSGAIGPVTTTVLACAEI